ncbi:hypothetical protein WJX81_007067 [Elliptochloris bilobata]|uniref:Uncharacterized protein n=1 Tax=Elliptochloris bilobata TaxID=381761 RepID=A0AAW1RC88_9CHLO
MGIGASLPERLVRAVQANDGKSLSEVLSTYQRQGQLPPLEARGAGHASWTPLILAAARGSYACLDLLLRAGANVQAAVGAEGSTALHEAIGRGNQREALLLLSAGANPFCENNRGLTAVDVAINQKNLALVRQLEARAPFAGYLAMKVPKFMGLGSEWKPRYIVVMPRWPAAGAGHLVRVVMLAYKSIDEPLPACKVWLDGAVARLVVGSKGPSASQCALTLHRTHAAVSGAYVTGDSNGPVLHLRPTDKAPGADGNLRRFIDVVNARGLPPPPAPPPLPSPALQGSATPPRHEAAAAASPARPQSCCAADSSLAQPGETDEQLARRLQQEYNAAAPGGNAGYPALEPTASPRPARPSSATPQRAPAPAPAPRPTPPAGPLESGAAVHYPAISNAPGGMPSRPSAPMAVSDGAGNLSFPTVGANMADAPPAAGAGGGGRPSAGAAPSGGPSGPPMSPPSFAENQGAHRRAESVDDDEGMCVVCLAAPATTALVLLPLEK